MQKAAVGKKHVRLSKSEHYIRCGVCKIAAEAMVKAVEEEINRTHHSKVGEVEIVQLAEAVCEPDDHLGEWMSRHDIIQEKDSEPLELKDKDQIGECRRECATIEYSCKRILEFSGEISEMLYHHTRPPSADQKPSKKKKASLTRQQVVSRICKKISSACPEKKMPNGFKHKDEIWMEIIDEEGYRMRKMQYAANKQAKDHGTQQVQFIDPGGPSSWFGGDGIDSEEL